MKAVLLLAGAAPPDEARAETEGARVYAADAGAHLAFRWGVVPDAVVGDMDSVDAAVLADLASHGSRILRHPADKLHTDGRLALDLALAEGADEVVFLAATGGRLDQTVANLQLLRRAAEAGVLCRAVEVDAALRVATPRRPVVVALPKGALFSVLPLTDEATGVSIEGARYPLASATMRFVDPYGVSNAAEGGPVRVACASGVLLVLEPRTG